MRDGYAMLGLAIIGFIILAIGASVLDSFQRDTVTVKVIELQQQQLIKKNHTDIRYLVITERETFVCKSDLWNGKFNSSDRFFHLHKDSTYTFNVAGFGKGFWFDYRNILEVVKR